MDLKDGETLFIAVVPPQAVFFLFLDIIMKRFEIFRFKSLVASNNSMVVTFLIIARFFNWTSLMAPAKRNGGSIVFHNDSNFLLLLDVHRLSLLKHISSWRVPSSKRGDGFYLHVNITSESWFESILFGMACWICAACNFSRSLERERNFKFDSVIGEKWDLRIILKKERFQIETVTHYIHSTIIRCCSY